MRSFTQKMALGTVQLGLNYGIANRLGKPKVESALEILEQAMNLGIDTVDTAPDYGESEHTIGQFIGNRQKNGKSSPKIITKLPQVKLSDPSNEDVYSYVRCQLKSSLRRLNMEKMEVCMLHHPKDMTNLNGKIVAGMLKCKEEGLIEKIGVSVYTPEETKLAIACGCFEAIQVPINILDQRLIQAQLLAELKENGIEIYARSIYLQGLLFLRPDELPEKLKMARKPLAKLWEMSLDAGVTPSEMSMLFVRDLPAIDKLVIGCESIQQLQTNFKTIHMPSLAEDMIVEICSCFSDLPEKILNPNLW